MNKSESRTSSGVKGRRKFLKGLAGAGGAAAVAIAAPAVAVPADEEGQDALKPVDNGYHVTKHIEDYYETARV